MPEPRPAQLTEPLRSEPGERFLTPARLGLDPRSKLLLVLLSSVAVMSPSGLRWVPAALLLAALLALTEGAWRRAIGILAAGAALGVLGWGLPLWWPHPVTVTVGIASAYLIRFAAVIGVSAHLIATTSPTALAAGLRAWHLPRPLTATLAVMLRVFPLVAAEANAVLDAMRLRGLTGARGMLRHPALSLERFAVPMIAASLRASEDLSASAMLRGLGSRRAPSAMHPPRFGTGDAACAILVAGLGVAAGSWLGPR